MIAKGVDLIGEGKVMMQEREVLLYTPKLARRQKISCTTGRTGAGLERGSFIRSTGERWRVRAQKLTQGAHGGSLLIICGSQ